MAPEGGWRCKCPNPLVNVPFYFPKMLFIPTVALFFSRSALSFPGITLLFSRSALLFSRITLLFSRSILSFPEIALLFSRSALLFSRIEVLFFKNALLFSRIALLVFQECLFLFTVCVFFPRMFFSSWFFLLILLRVAQRDHISLALVLFPLGTFYWPTYDTFLITLRPLHRVWFLCILFKL